MIIAKTMARTNNSNTVMTVRENRSNATIAIAAARALINAELNVIAKGVFCIP